MARPRTQRSPDETDRIAAADIDHEALSKAGDAASLQSQQLALIQQHYDIGMPFNYEAAVVRLRECAAIETSGAVEAGLVLLQIKAHTPGRFHDALETVGITPRWAQRRMQVVTRLKQFPSLRSLGFSKALELLGEDDATLGALEHDGAIAGITLDEIDRMSTRELKESLRKERAERADEKAADEEIIRKKDERINKLARRSTRGASREQIATLLEDLDRYSVEAFTFLKQVRDTVGAINTLYADAGEAIEEEVQQRIETNAESIRGWYEQLIAEVGE